MKHAFLIIRTITGLVFASAVLAQDQARSQPAAENAAVRLREIVVGHRVAMMVGVVAELGVADFLKDGPKRVDEIAQATKAHPQSLYRVLRALASYGIFTEDDDGRFGLTPMAEFLRSDVPRSQREATRSLTDEYSWRSTGHMLDAVRTGKTAMEHAFGMNLWAYFAKHPAAEKSFNARMVEGTRRASSEIVKAYNFSGARKVIDIAGGEGVLLADILKAHSHQSGVLFELPSVIEGARRRLEPALLARMELTSGDFFKSVPGGGDVYILKNILHDWEEERATIILKNIKRAMPKTSKLLVIEGVVPKGNSPSPTKMTDITMLVATGGRERTEAEHRALLQAGGFRLGRIVPVSPSTSILEATPE